MAVGADAEATAFGHVVDRRKDAVAEIGFGCRAEAGNRAGSSQPLSFVVSQMRGVDQAPALVDRHFVEQPLNRTTAAPGKAVFHFLGLLCDVNVDRACDRGAFEDYAHLFRRRGAQRMDGIAERLAVVAAERRQSFEQCEELIRIVQEGALAGVRGDSAEIGMGVEHRKMRKADASRFRSVQNAQRHFSRVCMRRAIGGVVQIVEFGDMAETALQHLHIELGGDRLDVVGVHEADSAVHFFPPCPEAVIAAAGHFGKACHGALEGVGMQVGNRRNQRPGNTFVAIADRLIGLDRDDLACLIKRNGDVLRPAGRQKRMVGEEPVDGKSCHVAIFLYVVVYGTIDILLWRASAK